MFLDANTWHPAEYTWHQSVLGNLRLIDKSSRCTIIATTRSRSRDRCDARSVSNPSLRSIPNTASTCPCGSDRVMRNASSAERKVSPRRLRRTNSTTRSGRCERLPSV